MSVKRNRQRGRAHDRDEKFKPGRTGWPRRTRGPGRRHSTPEPAPEPEKMTWFRHLTIGPTAQDT